MNKKPIKIKSLEDKILFETNSKYRNSQIKVQYECEICHKPFVISAAYLIPKTQLICKSCSKSQSMKKIVNSRKKEWCDRWKSSIEKKYGVGNIAFNKESQEKKKQTCLMKYGTEYQIESKSTRAKIEKMFEKKYNGNHTPMKDEKVKEKLKKTSIERYGGYFLSTNRDIIRKSVKKKYGVEEILTHPDIRKKIHETCLDKYGRIMFFPTRGYQYQGDYFDSSWELAYYIWLKFQNKQFVYHPQTPIEYTDEKGKIHLYYPDFLIDGQFYEIKGEQFFNEKGEPYDHYNKRYWWDKYNALIANKIIILKKEDLKEAFACVENQCGKNFLKSCKIKKDNK